MICWETTLVFTQNHILPGKVGVFKMFQVHFCAHLYHHLLGWPRPSLQALPVLPALVYHHYGAIAASKEWDDHPHEKAPMQSTWHGEKPLEWKGYHMKWCRILLYSTYTFSFHTSSHGCSLFCFSGSPRRSCSSSHWGPLAWNLPEVFTHPHPHHTRIWDDQVSKLRNLVFFFRGNIVKVSRTRNFNKKMNRNSKSINIQIDEWIKQMNE